MHFLLTQSTNTLLCRAIGKDHIHHLRELLVPEGPLFYQIQQGRGQFAYVKSKRRVCFRVLQETLQVVQLLVRGKKNALFTRNESCSQLIWYPSALTHKCSSFLFL